MEMVRRLCGEEDAGGIAQRHPPLHGVRRAGNRNAVGALQRAHDAVFRSNVPAVEPMEFEMTVNIAVMGAGCVGGWMGARLAASGAQVLSLIHI